MSITLIWFRRDLRLEDNPALAHALETGGRILPVYIHAPGEEGEWAPGAASRWWLHHSLQALADELARRGAPLVIRRGPSRTALEALVRETGATRVVWNRLYDPAAIRRDREIKAALRERGLQVESFNAALLMEPWTVSNRSGQPYRVFTPFWKACRALGAERQTPGPVAPAQLPGMAEAPATEPVEALDLLPHIRWDTGLAATWQPGEAGAQQALAHFAGAALEGYDRGRDLPGRTGTSRLSPHLHFGEIGPRQVMAVCTRARERTAGGVDRFLSELGWREFAHHLLFHFPETVTRPLDRRFEELPLADPREVPFEAWCHGRTGLPIVDAGMRELWHTGWMHNRVRMITASLLTKNLRAPWLEGARWFWDTLVDADLAANTLGWQWTAGCGADAAPYFRIFNPVLQGERFDAAGDYVRRWVPELAALPDRHLHRPWQAPETVLRAARLHLGRDYPRPVVDLAESRRAALAAFEHIKARPKAD
ncbi:cryptochrome/photolyase family protein [Ectothiorhodospira mobilis]|uniref:cryptochrome/photolyase family protein n=1 Tax=Ectothiorhodospira mobilis TaxID=195064 RepID=UPI00190374AE|nr:deoxyribodipyrimidine photo-lyase [Ectothiorhodospira mobilis]MBK1691438.1 deoxyribodipyrimidine photolyase [Ectothiorhodospira mobilis]